MISTRLVVLLASAVALAAGCADDDGALANADSSGTSTTSGATTTGATSGGSHAASSSGDSDGTGPAPPRTPPVCGDGIVEGTEQCDGDVVSGHPCPESCRFPPKKELWLRRIDFGDTEDRAEDVAIAPTGEIYLVGRSTTLTTPTTGLIVALSEDGEVLWSETELVDPPPGQGGTASYEGVAVGDGFVLATGTLARFSETRPVVQLVRYETSGARTWEREYQGPEPGTHRAVGLVRVSDDEFLSLADWEQSPAAQTASTILRYDGDGHLLETRFIHGPVYNEFGSSFAWPTDVAAAAGGYTVCGSSIVGTQAGTAAWVQRRANDGTLQWEDFAREEPDDLDVHYAVAVDATGNVVAVGALNPNFTDSDVWVHKYSSAGDVLWRATYDGNVDRNDYARGVVIDATGNVFVHGNSSLTPFDQGDNIDLWLRKYDPDGNELWTETWTGGGGGPGMPEIGDWDYASEIALDPRGFLVVTASTHTAPYDYDVLVRKLAP